MAQVLFALYILIQIANRRQISMFLEKKCYIS